MQSIIKPLNRNAEFFVRYKELHDELFKILPPEAYSFIIAYGNYVEFIDDLVDEERSVELINKTSFMASRLFASNYWLANAKFLIIVEQLIHVVYFNTVLWEKSPEAWKRRDAKAMSHCGYYMLFAVLLLETKDPVLVQRLSLGFMEKCHLLHYEDMSKEELEA